MENLHLIDDSRVTEIMQFGASDRATLYFACGLDETQANILFSNDWCFKMNISNAKVDPRHFALVDQFKNTRQYRAWLLMDCIRNRFAQGDGRLAALALLRSGTDFDCFYDENSPVCAALRNPFFKLRAEDASSKNLSLEAKDSEVQSCVQLLKGLKFAYGRERNITKAMDEFIGSNRWFFKQEIYPNNADDFKPIVVSFLVRHNTVESDPEIIITIEHTVVEPDKGAADDFSCDYNCDSYVEREGEKDVSEIEDKVGTSQSTVTLRVVNDESSDDVQFNLSSLTWEGVKEGFALCFPQCYIEMDISHIVEGVSVPLVAGDDVSVRNYVETCSFNTNQAVFVHVLTPNEVPIVVSHRKPDHIFRRPQHRVANAMFEMVCARLEEDGRSAAQYKRLQYVILVPKFNSLKQQTKERIEACAELVRDNEDASCLVELYPLTTASLARIEALQNEILDESNREVLYVFIVDECHYAPLQTAIPILHRSEVQSCPNFIALMVSATPYSCLSERSRVPRDNIIEWGEHIDANDRPNYIGFEHYFRSATFRLPSWELLLTIDGAPITINLPQHREFADFETLAEVITAQLQDCAELFGSTLRCAVLSPTSIFTFTFKRQSGGAQTVCIVCNDFLRGLGFTNDISFTVVSVKATAAKEPTVNDDTSVASQHMRQDSHFTELYKIILAACPRLERIGARAREPELLVGNGTPGPKAAIRPGETYQPLKHALMADKNGFTIIIDYIFSLAYFGSCRLLQQPDSTTFALGPLPTEVTDQMCNEFLKMLDESCYFDYSSDDARYPSVSCDISRAVKATLDALCSSAKEERPDLIDTPQLIKHILQSKVKEESNHASTSESQAWFTETDRIVWMLLVERKPAPMVLMRVFDKDENRSMQTILRHAMSVCGLVRQRAGRCNVPAFSVITDVSETSLLREIEPYYRDEYNVGDEGNPMHVRDIIALRKETQPECDTKVPNLDLKYEDLLNVPCLIILCEKGRMGDTFPHTLRALDLRLRTGGTASCFLQEIGRMCRYPRTQDSALVAVDALEAFFVDKQSKFGVTVSIPSSNAFLGVAKGPGDVSRILAGLGASDTMSHVQLAHLVHPLPYALIDPKVMSAIRRAINKREAEVFCLTNTILQNARPSESETESARTNCKIIKYLKMPRGVDDYLSCQIMKEPLSYKLMKSKNHYDFTNTATEKHDRRFLLSAECQVGKTGAYLHLLTLLRHAIEKGDNLQQVAPVAPTIPIGSLWLKWLSPCEENLRGQPSMQYDFPKTGKYHNSIARQRIAQLKMLLADSNNPIPLSERFATCIQEHEQVITVAGMSRLQALGTISVDDDYRTYVNWDGRYRCEGKWHPMLNETRSLASLIEEGVNLETPFVLDVNTEIANVGDADDDVDSPVQARFGTTFTPVCANSFGANAFGSVAKSVTSYQLSPRIVPLNDSVMVTLSNCFGDATALPRHQFGPDFSVELVTLSVPRNAFFESPGAGYNFTFDSGAGLTAKLHQPQRIKSWIFTPSFCGTAVGPDEKLLLRDDAFSVDNKPLTRWVDFGEVLVVRASQLEMYQQFYGGTHIIAALPDTMQFVDADGVVGPVMDAAKHGCGYARRFSQLLAQYMGWQSVWMIDDYVLKCWKLVCQELVCNPSNVSLEPASFAEVMLHIESIYFCQPQTSTTSTYPHLEDQVKGMATTDFSSHVTGAPSKTYGVIGMCRGKQWRSHIAHPIKRSHSVYSFFLLNVNATAGRNLYFPARPMWEDIEFNYLLDENDLLVCKLQAFAHEKLRNAAATAAAEPAPLESAAMSDLDKFMLWLYSNNYFPSNQRKEVLMLQPLENCFLTTVNDYIQSSFDPAADPQHACYISLVHNPLAFQRGALSGMNRSVRTLKSCMDNIQNESDLLEQAMSSVVTGEVGSATWLMIFPRTNDVPALDELLGDYFDPQRGLRLSYGLVPAPETAVAMGDAFVIICVTVQAYNDVEGDVSASMQVMQIGTNEIIPQGGASRNSTKRVVSARRTSMAGSGKKLVPQEQYMLMHGPALVRECDKRFAEQGLTETQGLRRMKIRDEIFRELVDVLNEMGPKKNIDSKWVYDWCKKRGSDL